MNDNISEREVFFDIEFHKRSLSLNEWMRG